MADLNNYTQQYSSELCRMPRGHICWEKCDPKGDQHWDNPAQAPKPSKAAKEVAWKVRREWWPNADADTIRTVEASIIAIVDQAFAKERRQHICGQEQSK